MTEVGNTVRKIKIKRNSLGDTRTATRVPTFDEFNLANISHRIDVAAMMGSLAEAMITQGKNHDCTKKEEPYRSLFYRELCAKIEGKIDSFEDGEWYPMHCKTERHHLNNYCPEDVNLVDVIEMICDCVCAGMARKGCVYPVSISTDILQRAVENTAQMCIDAVELEN